MDANLIAQFVTMALVIYFGWHLRTRLRTLQATVNAQKATIDAQAEHLKAQSTMLQNFESLNKTMKLVIDTVDAPAMVQRWQDYKRLVEIQAAQEQNQIISGFIRLISEMLPFIPHDQRMTLINSAALTHPTKDVLQELAEAAPSSLVDLINLLSALSRGLEEAGLVTFTKDSAGKPMGVVLHLAGGMAAGATLSGTLTTEGSRPSGEGESHESEGGREKG